MEGQVQPEGTHFAADSKPRARVRTYRDLIAWQKSHALALAVYRLTSTFPAEERFGLTAQVRRASVSVPSNIAEGYGRGGRADYARFLKLARGSLYEVDAQLLLAADLGHLGREQYQEACQSIEECERVLAGLIRAIDQPQQANSQPT